MKAVAKLVLAVLAMSAPLTGAVAAPVLDQFNHDDIYYTSGNAPFGQSFTAGLDGLFAAISFRSVEPYVADNAGPATVTVHAGASVFMPVIASAVLSPVIDGNIVTFYLSSLGVQLSANGEYTFNAVKESGGYALQAGSPLYAGGRLQLHNSPIPGYDAWFETFVEPGGSGVPEPAGWAMMLGGFGLLGQALRRRRRSVAAPC